MFENEDLDLSSGSDFDDDEDPDKIEVPGIIHSIFHFIIYYFHKLQISCFIIIGL